MAKQEVTQTDFEYLYHITSLQYVLISSASNPVVIRKVREGADFDMAPWGGMYWDCCENQEIALKTMKKRIQIAPYDLQEHARLHLICLEFLLEMDGAIIADDRSLFSENCEKLCENALKYVELVKKHQQRLQRDSFLEYPCSPGGHEFYVLNGRRVATSIFNKLVTCAGAILEIEKIQEKVIDFKIKSNPLPYIALPLDEQQGAGLLLPDLKNNLIRNELLLKRVNEKS